MNHYEEFIKHGFSNELATDLSAVLVKLDIKDELHKLEIRIERIESNLKHLTWEVRGVLAGVILLILRTLIP